MRTELGLVLKHVIGGAEKINALNYLSKPQPPSDECYYEENSYAVMNSRGVSGRVPKAQIRRIGAKFKETKVGSMVTIIGMVIMSEIETTTATTTSTGVTMVTEMIGMGPMSLLKIVKLLLGMVEIVWCELRICCTK